MDKNEINVRGILRSNPGREDRRKHKNDHQNDSEGRQWIVTGDAWQRDGESRHGASLISALLQQHVCSNAHPDDI